MAERRNYSAILMQDNPEGDELLCAVDWGGVCCRIKMFSNLSLRKAESLAAISLNNY